MWDEVEQDIQMDGCTDKSASMLSCEYGQNSVRNVSNTFESIPEKIKFVTVPNKMANEYILGAITNNCSQKNN